MTDRPFHHGNLRAELLDRAEQTLRDQGVDALSLRDLARQAGVSHGAPRSHFIDRQALLDALAERGFERMGDEIVQAGSRPGSTRERMAAVAAAYVRFAVADAALLEVMFSAKSDRPAAVAEAAGKMFSSFDALFDGDFAGGELDGADRPRTKLLFVAALQGIAALLTSHRVTEAEGHTLVTDAVDLLLHSPPGPAMPETSASRAHPSRARRTT